MTYVAASAVTDRQTNQLTTVTLNYHVYANRMQANKIITIFNFRVIFW